jgi:hypothetical protein
VFQGRTGVGATLVARDSHRACGDGSVAIIPARRNPRYDTHRGTAVTGEDDLARSGRLSGGFGGVGLRRRGGPRWSSTQAPHRSGRARRRGIQVRGQRSGVRGQESEVRGQGSGVRGYLRAKEFQPRHRFASAPPRQTTAPDPPCSFAKSLKAGAVPDDPVVLARRLGPIATASRCPVLTCNFGTASMSEWSLTTLHWPSTGAIDAS